MESRLKKYRSSLVKEGVAKALICGLIAGFSVDFIAAFITLFTDFNGALLSVVAGLAAVAVSSPLFYYKLFRPTEKTIARRVDRLGFEERMITMLELENDDSYIARRQREDARATLEAESEKRRVRFHFPKGVVVVAAAVAVAGAAMTLATGLADVSSSTEGPGTAIELPAAPIDYFSVRYVAEEGGYIEGMAVQLFPEKEKGNTTEVAAVADEGWQFAGWSDELTEPSRSDRGMEENTVFTAMFVRVSQGDGSGSDGDDDNSDSDDRPPDESDGGGGGDDSTSPPTFNPGSGGTYTDNSQIIDGETNYRQLYQYYYDLMMKILSEGGEVPEEIRAIVEAYFGALE